jgi:hypothetical protein
MRVLLSAYELHGDVEPEALGSLATALADPTDEEV